MEATPRLACPLQCCCARLLVQRELSPRWGQAVPQGPCLRSQGLDLYTTGCLWPPGGLQGFPGHCADESRPPSSAPILESYLSLALMADLEQLSVRLMMLSEGGPCPLFNSVGFNPVR